MKHKNKLTPLAWAVKLGYIVTTSDKALEVWNEVPELVYTEEKGLHWTGKFLFSIPLELTKFEDRDNFLYFLPDGSGKRRCNTWVLVMIRKDEISQIPTEKLKVRHNLKIKTGGALAKVKDKRITLIELEDVSQVIIHKQICDLMQGESL